MTYQSVVRIFVTSQEPDFDNPWQSETPSNSTGSGVVISRTKILTGAHVVANATFIQVQKVSDPDKAVAEVIGVFHDADLALLEVKDTAFLKDIKPAKVGGLPRLQDRVSVVGYPVGGREISITEGVVSRVEIQRYRHSRRSLLAVTVDAAINSGNSGGPVFKDDKVIGIAFQTLKDAENIGELVPAPIIEMFLRGVKRFPRMELPGLGIRVQNLENPYLRKSLGMVKADSGLLINEVDFGGSAWRRLKAGDVLLEIEGTPIANNGTIQYVNRFRTSYTAMLGDHYIGDTVKFKVLRNGKYRNIKVELKPLNELVPRWQNDQKPAYFVLGGLVFQRLTLDYIATWSSWWDKAPAEFLHLFYSGIRTEKQQEIIILTQILADEINTGYKGFYDEVIASINGVQPQSLAHFVRIARQRKRTIEIKTSGGGVVVFEKRHLAKANQRIMERYHIPSLVWPE